MNTAERDGWSICNLCGADVKTKNLHKHMVKHSKCPTCISRGRIGGCPACGKVARKCPTCTGKGRIGGCPTCGGTGRVYDPVIGIYKPCPKCKRTFILPPKKQEPLWWGAPPPGHIWWHWTGRR